MNDSLVNDFHVGGIGEKSLGVDGDVIVKRRHHFREKVVTVLLEHLVN